MSHARARFSRLTVTSPWLLACVLALTSSAAHAEINMVSTAVSVTEGNASVEINFEATDPAPAGGIAVEFVVVGVDATDGQDFDGTGPFLVTLDEGDLEGTVSIPLLQDTLDELDESFTVTIDIVTGDTDGDGDDDYIDDDSDDDGVNDGVDNCMLLANPNQEDLDDDGNGDLCVAECGDGAVQFGEDCDDPNDINCTPECTRACTPEICDGIDNDCDGEIDLVKDGNEGLRSVCEDDIALQGGGVLGLLGCSGSGSGADVGVLALLALPLMLRRRRRAKENALGLSLAVALALTSSATRAQEAQGLGVSSFTPAPIGTSDFVTVKGTAVNGHLLPTAAIVADYGYSQLQVKDRLTGAQVALLEHRLSADVVASISLFNRFAFWVGLPVSLYQAAGADEVFQPLALAPFALGDVRFGGRWSIVSMRNGPGVAFTLAGSGGTGSVENLTSAGAFTFKPQLNAGWRFGDAGRVALNLGYLFRPQQELLTLRVGNELTYGVGGEMPVFLAGLSGIAELNGRLSADPAITGSQATSPLETLVGARYLVADGHAITAGAAVGITAGYGTPLMRGFVGYTWSPHGADRDGDIVPDDVDRCPDIPEDEDFYEDSDGCPDEDAAVDADEDGIVDIASEAGAPVDQCPDLPEDKDGFEDDDGCPDVDHDGDGLDEGADRCPDEPEDRDGFQDDDGCPDVDNDGDGLHDSVDRCPNAAEVRNGFEDDDGCPDVPPTAPAVASVDPPPTTEQTPPPDTATTPPPTTGAPPPPMQGAPGAIIFPQKIYFTVAGAVLTPEGRRLVDQVAETMKQHPQIRVEVQGHTDGQGDDSINDHLALRRAESVVGYLVSRGVERPRLLIAILGKSMPLAPNDSPRERALNRRVEFRVLAEGDEVR